MYIKWLYNTIYCLITTPVFCAAFPTLPPIYVAGLLQIANIGYINSLQLEEAIYRQLQERLIREFHKKPR